MPNGKRPMEPRMRFHVFFHAVAGEVLFRDDEDHARFVTRYAKVLAESDIKSFAASLVVNHAHFVQECGVNVWLGDFWQRVNGPYAQEYNKRWKRRGRLFSGPYQTVVISSDHQLLVNVRYVHLNRVKAGLVSLEDIERDPWSGVSEIAGLREPRLLTVDPARALFSRDPMQARAESLEWLKTGVGEPGWYEKLDRLITAMPVYQVPPPIEKDPIEILEEACEIACRTLEVFREDLLGGSRRSDVSRARALVTHLALTRGVKRRRCADFLRVNDSAIERLRRRGEVVADLLNLDALPLRTVA